MKSNYLYKLSTTFRYRQNLYMVFVLALLLISRAYADLPDKTLNYCSEGSPVGFDPSQFITSVEYTASAFTIYNRLIQFKRGTTNIEPGLALRWDISPDGLIYTFYLRRGVKFHATSFFNPTRDFNADDVLFTFERMRDPEHPFRKAYPVSFSYFLNLGLDKEIQKIEAIDSYTVRFTLKSVNATFLTNLSLAFASILSAEYADQLLKAGKAEDINWKPIGTGPFIFHSYNKDATIRFSGNPYYWRISDVQVSQLNFKITPDSAVRIIKLKENECQVTSYPRPEDLASIKTDMNLRLLSQPGLNLGFLAYNVLHKPFDNILVRRALDMGINKKAIINAAFQNQGDAHIANTMIPPALWSYREQLEENSYNLKEAKKLLTRAGYPNGFKLSLWASPLQKYYSSKLVAEIIQSDWKKIGVEADIVSHEWGEFVKRARAGEHDAVLVLWTGNSDLDDWFGALLSCDARNAANLSKWCNQPFDDLIIKARKTIDPIQREIFYKEAQQIFKRELPLTPILHATIYQPINKKVTNFKINPLNATLFTGVGLE